MFFLTLSSAILFILSSNCFSFMAFSVRSLILLISSRTLLALARRHRPGGLVLEVAVAAVASSKIACWEPPASFEPEAVREEMTQVCSS